MMEASIFRYSGAESDSQPIVKWPEKLKKPALRMVPFPTTSMRLQTSEVGEPSHSPTAGLQRFAQKPEAMISGASVDYTGYAYNDIVVTSPYIIPDLIALEYLDEKTGYYSDEIYKQLQPILNTFSPNDLVLCKGEGNMSPIALHYLDGKTGYYFDEIYKQLQNDLVLCKGEGNMSPIALEYLDEKTGYYFDEIYKQLQNDLVLCKGEGNMSPIALEYLDEKTGYYFDEIYKQLQNDLVLCKGEGNMSPIALHYLDGKTGYYFDEIYKQLQNDLVLCKGEGNMSPSINAGGRNYRKFGNLVISEPNGIGWDEPGHNTIGRETSPLSDQYCEIDIPEEAAGGDGQINYPDDGDEVIEIPEDAAGGDGQINYPDDGDEIIDIPEEAAGGNGQKQQQQQQNYNWGIMGQVVSQAVAGVLANRITAAGSHTSLRGVHVMEAALVFGLGFKLAPLVLPRLNQQWLATRADKIGDMVIASAIILSLAMHIPPLMAWIAAPLAALIISTAIVFRN